MRIWLNNLKSVVVMLIIIAVAQNLAASPLDLIKNLFKKRKDVAPMVEIDKSNVELVTIVQSSSYNQLLPAISRDSKKIAYVTYAFSKGKNADIAAVDVKGASPAVVTTSSQDELYPTWAEGSLWLVYTRVEGKITTLYKKNMETSWESPLYIKLPSGAQLIPYMIKFSKKGFDGPAVIVGKMKEFKAKRFKKDMFKYKKWNNDEVWFLPSLNDVPRKIGPGRDADISPDGRYVVYTIFEPDMKTSGIYIWDSQTMTTRSLTSGYRDATPAFSPDGEEIVFARWEGDNWNLWKMRIDGSNQTRLTVSKSDELYPSWGLGGWIYFQSDALNKGKKWDIWKLKIRR